MRHQQRHRPFYIARHQLLQDPFGGREVWCVLVPQSLQCLRQSCRGQLHFLSAAANVGVFAIFALGRLEDAGIHGRLRCHEMSGQEAGHAQLGRIAGQAGLVAQALDDMHGAADDLPARFQKLRVQFRDPQGQLVAAGQ